MLYSLSLNEILPKLPLGDNYSFPELKLSDSENYHHMYGALAKL